MWAILAQDERTVIGVVLPTATYDEAVAENPNSTLIEMTADNSPAYMLGIWDGKRFYPPTSKETDGALC